MSYLGRIAGRVSGAAAGGSAPALRSQSPLVAYDQRLATPQGAEIPHLDALGGDASIEAEWGEGTEAESAFDTVAPGRPAPGMSAITLPGAEAFAPAAAEGPVAVAAPSPASPRDERAAPPMRAALEMQAPIVPPVASSAAPIAPQAHRLAPDAPAVRPSQTAPGEARDAPTSPRFQYTPPERAEPPRESPHADAARALHDAFSRLEAWMRTPTERPADAKDAATPALPSVPVRAAAPRALAAPPRERSRALAPQAPPQTQGAPRLTIGHIEVEVLPPPERPRPERRESRVPGRLAALADRSASFSAVRHGLLFGLRQR
jgi:hypothetical protein